jgi:hypothetical protein
MKNADRKIISIMAIITFALFIIPTATAGPLADFGDAPDPTFPSLLASDGARHLDSSHEWLGDSVDSESDSKQINQDLFDDGVELFPPYEPNQQGKVNFTVNVTDAHGGRYSSAPDKLIYVNAWFDWNCDGDWNDADEHVIDGRAIDPSTFPLGVNNMTFTETFTIPSSAVRGLMWIRFRLDYGQNVNTMTGEADFGEVEDHRTSGNFFDLYLDPYSVPEDFYDEFFIPASGTVFFDKLLGQGDITAVRISPPITDGYVPEYIPVEDYSVYLNTNGTSEVHFFRSGIFALQVERNDPTSTDVSFVYCNAGKFYGKEKKKPSSVPKVIPVPQAEVIIVEDPGKFPNGTSGDFGIADLAAEVYKKHGRTIERANSVNNATKKVDDASDKKGGKVSVVIDGHGNAGYQNIGRGQGNIPAQKDEVLGKRDYIPAGEINEKKFIKEKYCHISSLRLMGCLVGKGAKGEAFLQRLANGLCVKVCAYDVTVGVAGPSRKNPKGYFSIDIHGGEVCKDPNIVGKINLTNRGPEYQEVLPGGTAEFTIRVKNEGCVKDTIQLTHENILESGYCSWTVGLSKNSITLNPCNSEDVTLSVTAASNCEVSSRKKVKVTGTSQNGLDVSETITDSVIKETHVIPEFATIAIPVAAILGLLFLFSRRKRKE